jgi:hypothetical protein
MTARTPCKLCEREDVGRTYPVPLRLHDDEPTLPLGHLCVSCLQKARAVLFALEDQEAT